MTRTKRTISLALSAAVLFALPAVASAADPTTADCLAASNSSIDLKNDRKLRAARAQRLVCSAASCPGDIRKECMRRVEETNAQIPTIIFEAKDGTGKDLSWVKVTMDGEPFAERLEGTALSLDPGTHGFTFETTGQPPVQREFIINAGEKDRREHITFGASSALPVVKPPPSSSQPPPAAAPVVPPPSAPQRSTSGSTQRVLAVVAGGVGVAGLAAGAIFGVQALSKRDDANKACPDKCADQNGVNLWNDAVTTGDISTALLAVGAVGVVGGAILWLTATPAGTESSAQVALGPGGVQVRGSW